MNNKKAVLVQAPKPNFKKLALKEAPKKNLKIVILKMEICDDKIKKKAVKAVSGITGLQSVKVDKEHKKITVVGDVDPGQLETKLKKACHIHIQIDFVGPAEEVKKPEDGVLKRVVMALFS